jgi:amino acid permease
VKTSKHRKIFEKFEVEDEASSTTTSSSFLHSITDMLKAGGVFSSMFSLFAATFDAGIITLPYLAAENGVVVAVILIIFGALTSYFCAMLLVDCAEKVGKNRYQDFALYCWGPRASKLVGICNLVSMLGYVVSYIVFVKTLIPQILQLFLGENAIPEMLGEGQWKGEALWGTVYVF